MAEDDLPSRPAITPAKSDGAVSGGAVAPRSPPGTDVAKDAPGFGNGVGKASSGQEGENGQAESGAAAGGQGERAGREGADASAASSPHRPGASPPPGPERAGAALPARPGLLAAKVYAP